MPVCKQRFLLFLSFIDDERWTFIFTLLRQRNQSSRFAISLKDVSLDLVLTLCGRADENCRVLLTKAELAHVGFDDPTKLADEAAKRGGDGQQIGHRYELEPFSNQ